MTHLIIVDTLSAAGCADQWIADDVLDKWADVQLPKDEAQRVG